MLGGNCSPCCSQCSADVLSDVYNNMLPLMTEQEVLNGTLTNHLSVSGVDLDLSAPAYRTFNSEGGWAYWENNDESAFFIVRTNNLSLGSFSYAGCTFAWQKGGRIIFTGEEPFYEFDDSNTAFPYGHPEFSFSFSWLLLNQWSGSSSLNGPWRMQLSISDRSGNADGFSAYPTFNSMPLGMWSYGRLVPSGQNSPTLGWQAKFAANTDTRCYSGATIFAPFERHPGITLTLDPFLFPRECGECQNGAMCHAGKPFGTGGLPTNFAQGCFEGSPALANQGLIDNSYAGAGTTCETTDPCGDCPCGNGESYELPILVTVRLSDVEFVNPLSQYQCEEAARSAAAAVLENTSWTLERQGSTNEFAINSCQTFGSDYCGSVCEGKLTGGNFSNRPSIFFPCGQDESFGQYNSSTQRVQWGVIKFENCPPASNGLPFSYVLNMNFLRSALSIVRENVQCDGSRAMMTSASVASEGQLFVTHLLQGVGDQSCGTVAWNITGTTIYEAMYDNPLP